MKKRIILMLVVIAMLVCVLAITSSAATVPDLSKDTVTLSDKTVCALYDTNGNALIWYKSTLNADDGYANYDFIRADSGNGEEGYEGGTVYFKATWSGSSATNSNFEETKNAITLYEVSEVRIVDKDGNAIGSGNIVVFNIKDDDVKSNDGSYLDKPVTCIKEIFNNNDVVEYIYFHPCLAALQQNAIKGCANLKYVNFVELVNLRQIDGGTTVESNPMLFLGGACDFSNTQLVTVGASGAMANNAYSELIFPKTLMSIGNYPFEKNPNLTRVVFNGAVKSASGINHFYNCTSLTTVEGFGGTALTTVNQGFFENCPITSITIPETVTSIGINAFANTDLTEVVIPNGVTSLGQNAFKNCSELTTIKLGKSVNNFGGYDVLHTCSKLTTIYMPAGITGSDLRNEFLNSNAISTVYYIGTLDELNAFCTALDAAGGNTNFTGLTKISVDDYAKLADKSGKYIIYDYSACDAYYNGAHAEKDTVNGNACYLVECENCSFKNKYIGSENTHNLLTTYEYANGFMAEGQIVSICQNKGCNHSVKENAITSPLEALFTCVGFSAPVDGGDELSIGYTVNSKAILAYEAATGKTVKYGVYAVLKDKLGSNDIFDSNGKAADGVINAEVEGNQYTMLEFRITGFTDAHKDVLLAIGAYAKVIDGENTEYSYMQPGTPNENENYFFVSYNDIVGKPATDKAE